MSGSACDPNAVDLSPRIPNHNLKRCHESNAIFPTVNPLTLRATLRTIRFRLWDEQLRRLVSFRPLRKHAA